MFYTGGNPSFSFNLKEVPHELFHYCVLGSLMGIIQSNTVWLSAQYSTNDPTENQHLASLVREVISKQFGEGHPEIVRRIEQSYFHGSGDGHLPAYLFCLSEKGDDLDQWRNYASDARGISIGFHPDVFSLKPAVGYEDQKHGDNLGIHQILYEPEEQKPHIEAVLNYYKKGLLNSDEKDGKILCHYCGIALHILTYTCKNAAYKNEMEWRISHVPSLTQAGGRLIIEHSISDICFRGTQHSIASYFPMRLPSPELQPIRKIILGPQCQAEPHEIDLFLAAHGHINVRIERSKVPYRSA